MGDALTSLAGTRVYRDEPIPWEALPEAGFFTPPRYREMRKIAGGVVPSGAEAEAKLFYEQGKFMEDFEDDCDFRGTFLRYLPTYCVMSDAQLRGYFSWRTRVRRGAIERTCLSFAVVYVYELLNQIGVRAPEEGFYALRNFQAAYGALDAGINLGFSSWMRDYAVYYDLDKSLLNTPPPSGFDEMAGTLLNHRARSEDDVFAALNALSSYDITASRLFKQHPADVRRIVCGVFARLTERYGWDVICETFLGENYAHSHTMFQSAVFYDRLERTDCVYEVNEFCRYRCADGRWSRERLLGHKGRAAQTGALLKTIDRLMRLRYGFKPPLKPTGLPEPYRDIIQEEIERGWEARERAARPAVEIDLSKLRGIREAALETQNKLIVEAPNEEPEPPKGFDDHTNRGQGDRVPLRGLGQSPKVLALTGAERRLLACLLRGERYRNPDGPMLSVLIDGINEKLFETFGDTVIACEGDEPALIEDYRDELRGIIGE